MDARTETSVAQGFGECVYIFFLFVITLLIAFIIPQKTRRYKKVIMIMKDE